VEWVEADRAVTTDLVRVLAADGGADSR
jgi:hypothetical protein